MPQFRDTRAAVRTTLSASSELPPDRAKALLYKFVVATFKKANKYVAPSKKVVAGPRAANCLAESAADPDNPTNDVSTRLKRGPETHRAKQGMANLRKSRRVGMAGRAAGRVAVPPPRRASSAKRASASAAAAAASSSSSELFLV